MADYDLLKQVGEGTYGKVYMARNRNLAHGSSLVALKKLKVVSDRPRGPDGRSPPMEGFATCSVREVKILTQLKHENIVNLVEIITNRSQRRPAAAGVDLGEEEEESATSSIYMVFEYCEYDLQGLLEASRADASVRILPQHVRSWTWQLLSGVQAMHKAGVLHRDLKGANILISKGNQLKVADWGLARRTSQKLDKLTPKCVFTRGFAPLEILFDSATYGPSSDMWSVGCILGELLLRRPLFPVLSRDQTTVDHVRAIFDLCGTPKLAEDAPGVAADPRYRFDVWPTVGETPAWSKAFAEGALARPVPRALQRAFGGNAHEARSGGALPRVTLATATVPALDLLERLLHLDPSRRVTAAEALQSHDYFFNPSDGPVKLPHECVCARARTRRARAHEGGGGGGFTSRVGEGEQTFYPNSPLAFLSCHCRAPQLSPLSILRLPSPNPISGSLSFDCSRRTKWKAARRPGSGTKRHGALSPPPLPPVSAHSVAPWVWNR